MGAVENGKKNCRNQKRKNLIRNELRNKKADRNNAGAVKNQKQKT